MVRRGTLADLNGPVDHDLTAVAFRDRLAGRGVMRVGGTLAMTSTIPVSRGLGSSGAATVAGLALAAAAAGEGLEVAETLCAAAAREGHADNVAPMLLGGLVGVAWDAAGHTRAFRLPLSERLGFVFAAPAVEVTTAAARSVLPRQVEHDAATRGLGRLAALLHGLATGDGEFLRIGFQDELHVPYRLQLIPGAPAVFAAALDAGAYAITVSGSGSGLIAVCPLDLVESVVGAMKEAVDAGPIGGVAFPVTVDYEGVQVIAA